MFQTTSSSIVQFGAVSVGMMTIVCCSSLTEPDPVWLNDVVMEKLSELLERMLSQTIECLADERWELRRMGKQVRTGIVSLELYYF